MPCEQSTVQPGAPARLNAWPLRLPIRAASVSGCRIPASRGCSWGSGRLATNPRSVVGRCGGDCIPDLLRRWTAPAAPPHRLSANTGRKTGSRQRPPGPRLSPLRSACLRQLTQQILVASVASRTGATPRGCRRNRPSNRHSLGFSLIVWPFGTKHTLATRRRTPGQRNVRHPDRSPGR